MALNQIGPSQLSFVYELTSGDNTAGLQAALNKAIASGWELQLIGTGACASALTTSAPFKMRGQGAGITVLNLNATTGIGLTINTNSAFQISDLTIAGTATTLVEITAPSYNSYSTFRDCFINPATSCTGVQWLNAQSWTMDNCVFTTQGNAATGLNIACLFNEDYGGNTLSKCKFYDSTFTHTGTIGINWQSSGGMHFDNCIFEGIAYEVLIDLAPQGASPVNGTSDFIFDSCTFENFTQFAIGFQRQSGATGTLSNIQINNCQFADYFEGTITQVQAPTDAGGTWLYNFSMSHCLHRGDNTGTHNALVLDDCSGISIIGNSYDALSGVMNSITLKSGCAHGVVGLSTLFANGGTCNGLSNLGTAITTVAPT